MKYKFFLEVHMMCVWGESKQNDSTLSCYNNVHKINMIINNSPSWGSLGGKKIKCVLGVRSLKFCTENIIIR